MSEIKKEINNPPIKVRRPLEITPEKWKSCKFFLSEEAHAEMLLKFRYDNMKQRTFFKILVKAYIEDNPHMRALMKDINSQKISARDKRKMKKDENLEKKQVDLFGLNENDIEDIYDQIESDEKDE